MTWTTHRPAYMTAFFNAWWNRHQDSPVTASDLVQLAHEHGVLAFISEKASITVGKLVSAHEEPGFRVDRYKTSSKGRVLVLRQA